MQRLLLGLVLIITFNSAQAIEIIDKPIVFDEKRKALTLDYMAQHYGMVQDSPTIKPTMVVVHWTVIPTFEQTFRAFNRVELPKFRKAIAGAGSVNVSSQFAIDRDGTIYRLMPETTMARHVIGLNYTAIGIENIANGTDLPLTEAQFKANLELIRYLANKYPIEFVFGHSEYGVFKGTEYWKEKDDNYFTHKTDPGTPFMDRIRQQLADLKLLPLPVK